MKYGVSPQRRAKPSMAFHRLDPLATAYSPVPYTSPRGSHATPHTAAWSFNISLSAAR